jgi:RNA polymerase sigma-70 factor (ECF subfamily)
VRGLAVLRALWGPYQEYPMPVDKLPATPGPSIAELKHDLLESIPKLRAYSRNLCRNAELADDLVQEALVKALAHTDTFIPGSNLTAWLYTILRNEFFSAFREQLREGGDNDAQLQARRVQAGHKPFFDVRNAVTRLTAEHREALMLIGSGLSYQEAALMCDCASGTMKSRVSRARDKLAEMFDYRQATAGDANYGLVPDGYWGIGAGAMRAG